MFVGTLSSDKDKYSDPFEEIGGDPTGTNHQLGVCRLRCRDPQACRPNGGLFGTLQWV